MVTAAQCEDVFWGGAGAPLLGTLQSGLSSSGAPGGPPLPQMAPLLPPNLLQSPVGMHMAMYNMLLLQNPQLRAQLPAVPSRLGGDPLCPEASCAVLRGLIVLALGGSHCIAPSHCCDMALDKAQASHPAQDR